MNDKNARLLFSGYHNEVYQKKKKKQGKFSLFQMEKKKKTWYNKKYKILKGAGNVPTDKKQAQRNVFKALHSEKMRSVFIEI